MIINGWQNEKHKVAKRLKQFWNSRDQLTIQNDIIYRCHHIFILESMQAEILSKNIVNYFGVESNIRMAREVLFWLGLRKAIIRICVIPVGLPLPS